MTERENELHLQMQLLTRTFSERCLTYMESSVALNTKCEELQKKIGEQEELLERIRSKLGDEAYNEFLFPPKTPTGQEGSEGEKQ